MGVCYILHGIFLLLFAYFSFDPVSERFFTISLCQPSTRKAFSLVSLKRMQTKHMLRGKH